MAGYIKTAAILARVREVIVASLGTRWTVPVGRFQGGIPDGLSDQALLQRTIAAVRVEPEIVKNERSKSSPPVTGSVQHYDITVRVRVDRILTQAEQLDDGDRDALLGLAMEDGDVIAAALSVPGQLATTSAAAPTDLASGMLRFVSSTPARIRTIDQGAQLVRTTHDFEGVALARR